MGPAAPAPEVRYAEADYWNERYQHYTAEFDWCVQGP